MQFYLILSLLFALIVAIFAIQNSVAVPIRFLFWRYNEAPLVFVIFGSAILGALVIGITGFAKQLKLKLKIREYKHQISKIEEELKLLKDKNQQNNPVGGSGNQNNEGENAFQ